MESYLTAADAGRILNVAAATVRLMIRRGTLRVAARTEGGIQLLTRRHVESLARARATKASAAPHGAAAKA